MSSQQTATSTASDSIQPFKLKTVQELYDTPPENIDYCVENLLPSGGFSVLVGKPKAGKTTLARQLVVAVAQGRPFLNRRTDQCAVIYIAMEEKESEVRSHFNALGLQGADPVHILCERVSKNTSVAMLEATFKGNPKLKLAVIDPVFRFVSVKDSNDYIQVTNALEGLLNLTRNYGVHILTVHHKKKKDTDDLTDGALGSTAISGSVDTYIDLRKDRSGLRTLCTDQRYGINLAETQLIWDMKSRRLSLGKTCVEVEEEGAKRGEDRVTQEIINYIHEEPGCTQAAIFNAVTGRTSTIRAMFRGIVEQGLLEEEGQGTKVEPYRYTLKAVPTEEVSPTEA